MNKNLNVIFLVLFSVLLFAHARAQAPDAAIPVAAVPLIADSEHAHIYSELVALREANVKLKAEVVAPKPVGTQGVMASLPVLLGLLAVFVRRIKPPASLVHESWFIPASTAAAAILSALAEAATVGALTWNTAIAAAVGGLSTWAGASYTTPKAVPPTLVPPAGPTT